jgi:hypothetical protein
MKNAYATDPPQADDDQTPPIDKSGLSDERKKLFERVEQINRAWLDSMREMRRTEAEFSVRLFSCNGPSDALVLCNQWMAKRLEILGAEQQTFAKSWAELVALLGKATTPADRKKKQHDETSD